MISAYIFNLTNLLINCYMIVFRVVNGGDTTRSRETDETYEQERQRRRKEREERRRQEREELEYVLSCEK